MAKQTNEATVQDATTPVEVVTTTGKVATFQVNHVDGNLAHLGSIRAADGRPNDITGALSISIEEEGFFQSGSTYTVTVTKNSPNQMV